MALRRQSGQHGAMHQESLDAAELLKFLLPDGGIELSETSNRTRR